MRVAGEFNLAHLHSGAFLDVEVHLHRGRGNRLHLFLDGGELVPVLGEQILEHLLYPLDLGWIVLALNRKPNLFLLQAVQDIRLGDRVKAFIVDLADRGLLPDKDVQDNALLRVLALDAQIVEVRRVPQRVEVALNRQWVVGVARMRKEARQDRLFGDAPVADHPDRINGLRLLGQGCAGAESHKGKDRHQRQTGDAGAPCLHRAGAMRRAKVLVRSIVRLHGKNIATLTAEI